MYRKIQISLLIVAIGTSLLLILTPDWFKNGSYEDFQAWYPVFGKIIYVFIHILSYGLIVIGFLLPLLVNFKNNCNRVKRHRLEFFYFLTFLVLIVQFAYCMSYSEFYPAVMMPSFSNGKMDPNHLTNEQFELTIVSQQGKNYVINMKDLLDGMPESMKSSALKQLERKQNYDQNAFLRWLQHKISSDFSISDPISVVEINRISTVYSFRQNNLKVLRTEIARIKRIER